MTMSDLESSWEQLKGDVQQRTRTSQRAAALEHFAVDTERTAERAELVSCKRSHVTAFIRRRSAGPSAN